MRVHSSKRFFYLDSSWLGSNTVVIFIIYFARGHGRSCTSAIRWCKGTLITEIRRGVVESLILGIRYEFLFSTPFDTSCSSVFSWGTPSIVVISGMRKRVRACCSRGNWELSPGPNRGILSDQLLSYTERRWSAVDSYCGTQTLWYDIWCSMEGYVAKTALHCQWCMFWSYYFYLFTRFVNSTKAQGKLSRHSEAPHLR